LHIQSLTDCHAKTKQVERLTTQSNREVFDQIAESWYRLRHWSRFTEELKELALRWQKGKLLNLGCAHGPDFLPFKSGFGLHGIDFSKEMVKMAQKYAAKFDFEANLAVADAMHLPFADATFDWAIAVAAYHHIEGHAHRQQAFQELKRVLKPGGEAFITVWNRWQPGFWLKGKETQVSWKSKDKILHRYYYLYTYHELRRELRQAGFEVRGMFPEKAYRFPVDCFSKNICALVRTVG
jgi:SAM-dependent methyltransferase